MHERGNVLSGLRTLALASVPAAMLGLLLGLFLALQSGTDVHVFWQAGRDALHGINPYPPPDEWILKQGESFVYPAGALLFFAPIGLLPFHLAELVVLLASITAPAIALRLLDLHDWRCYALAYASPAVAASFSPGAISPLLMLVLAVLWRMRELVWPAALAAATLIGAKLFLWPLLVWLWVTDRRKTALAATLVGVTVTLATWAIIGFRGLGDYPHLLLALSNALEGTSNSAVGLTMTLGASAEVAHVLAALAGLVALLGVVLSARRPGGEQAALSAALAAAFLFSPVIRMHYFCLLLVPIALYRPRLSPLWAAPILLWLAYLAPVGNSWYVAVSVVVLIVASFATSAPGLVSTAALRDGR